MSNETLRIKVRVPRGDFTLDVDTQWPLTGVTALFGRSGCGKTTLLRIIAGLEKVNAGRVSFAGADWQTAEMFLPIEKRRVGLVFQEASLLPHLSVTGNLLYGFKRTPEVLRRLQPDAVINMLGLENLLDRRVEQLSGGQAQRVALGRALLSSPQLLLLDEPLAALDTQTKREIMPFLSRLSRDSNVPIVLITHSPEEVQRLADRVVFMRDGVIDDICDLQQAMSRPDSPLFADEGPASVLTGPLSEADAQGVRRFGVEQAQLFVQTTSIAVSSDSPVTVTRLRVLARDVSVALDDPSRISIRNHLRVVIREIHELPDNRLLLSTTLADGQCLLIEITRWSAQQLNLQTGQEVWALIKSVALVQ
ncbi:MAG: molybdenum ABC transporter ATP-binding protein [Pseudohongiella sp.]|nr:molybdenum ABC transporter ATP-binding protein [Pseudohongiella sp.]